MPKISVIMPTYNAQTYLKEAIDSILSQTFSDFELLVIDDNSTDATLEILRSYDDERIRVIHGDCKGLPAALNKGILEANGEYIARMDADDISLPERFSKQVAFLETNSDIGLCSTWVSFINRPKRKFWGVDITTPIAFNTSLLFFNPIIHPTVMFKKKLFESNNVNYNENFYNSEDYELWCQLINKIKIGVIEENLFEYRLHEQNVTNKFKDKGKSTYLLIIKNNISKHCDLNISNNLTNFFWYELSEEVFSEVDIFRYLVLYMKIIKRLESQKQFECQIVKKFFSQQLDLILTEHINSMSFYKLRNIFKKFKSKNTLVLDLKIDALYLLKYLYRNPFGLFKAKNKKHIKAMFLKYLLKKGL